MIDAVAQRAIDISSSQSVSKQASMELDAKTVGSED